METKTDVVFSGRVHRKYRSRSTGRNSCKEDIAAYLAGTPPPRAKPPIRAPAQQRSATRSPVLAMLRPSPHASRSCDKLYTIKQSRSAGIGWPLASNRSSETIRPAILNPENYPANAKRLTWHGYYAFRRGIATLASSISRDPMAAKGLLRHSSVNTTLAHYIKDVPDVTKNAMTQVEQLFTRLEGEAIQ